MSGIAEFAGNLKLELMEIQEDLRLRRIDSRAALERVRQVRRRRLLRALQSETTSCMMISARINGQEKQEDLPIC